MHSAISPARIGGNGYAWRDFVFLSGQSPAMRALERAADQVSRTTVPVLIMGESGAGKRSLALRIHQLAGLDVEQFHEFSCSSLAGEFFAKQNGNGAVAMPTQGTVLLTEVADMPAAAQTKLALALAGEDAARAGAPRLIFTSCHNLDQEVRSGRIKEELYYRISGVCLRVPPLRHRREDIAPMMDFFLQKYCALFGRSASALAHGTMKFLTEYSWPGNVRELEEAAKTFAAITDERVAMAALRSGAFDGKKRNGDSDAVSLKDASRAASRQAEKELILKVLSRTRWNRKRAAEELRISYKALLYKLKQIGLDDDLNVNFGEEI